MGHHLPVCGGAGPEPAPDPPAVDGGGHGAGQARLLASRRREDAQERSGLNSSSVSILILSRLKGSVLDADPRGSALMWLSWIRILIGNADLDPGVDK